MNNILEIKNFLSDEKEDKMIINQVSDHIGIFYDNLISYYCDKFKIRIFKEQSLENTETNSLFSEKKINLFYSNNLKNIEKIMKIKDKAIIFSDYKVYKKFEKNILALNGYNYTKDINYYIKDELGIGNLDIKEFCVSNPHLTFSEISKYLVNSDGYVADRSISEKNNSILDIRKELFNLKRNGGNMKTIYENLKKEVRYKKFNFLIY